MRRLFRMTIAVLSITLCSHVIAGPFIDPDEIKHVIETARPDSPLKDYALRFVLYGLAYDVDPRLMVAISAAESTYGTNPCPEAPRDPRGKHNAWGWFWGGGGTCTNSPVYSWDGGIRGATKNVRHKTFNEQSVTKLDDFNGEYCTSDCQHWLVNACDALNGFRDTRGFCDARHRTSAAFNGYTFDFRVETLFSSNAEDGTAGWSYNGFWHSMDSPDSVRVSPDIYPTWVTLGPREEDRQLNLVYKPGYLAPAYSRPRVWWFGQESTGTYIGEDFRLAPQQLGGVSRTPNSGDLITPPIDLAGYRKIYLVFFTVWEIESVDVDAFDLITEAVKVDVLANGNYQQIATQNPPSDLNGQPQVPYASGTNIFEPFSPSTPLTPIWTPDGADLSRYAGNTIRIRFRFDTRDTLYNGFRGWMIDDIKVFGVR